MVSAFPMTYSPYQDGASDLCMCFRIWQSKADGQSLCWCLFESMQMVHLVSVPFWVSVLLTRCVYVCSRLRHLAPHPSQLQLGHSD